MKPSFLLCLLLPLVASACTAQQTPPQPPQLGEHTLLLTIETLPWRETKWRTVPVRQLEDLPGYDVTKVDAGFSTYGGLLSKKAEATGFFHVQKVGGRWWMVDPEGYLFLNRGMNAVGMSSSEPARTAFAKKFGTKEQWAIQTGQLLRDSGFNGAANWSDDDTLNRVPNRLPYTPSWNFMGTYKKERHVWSATPGKSAYPGDAIFVFDKEFPDFCDRHAQQLTAFKDDPYLIGHFSDNELPFFKNSLDNFLKLDHEDPGYKAALSWLQQQHGAKASDADITDDDRQKFVALVGEKYFSIVSKAIKKYDPNHMYLGSRFHGNVMDQPLFMQTVGPYIDAVSINYYGQWTPRAERIAKWASNTGRPFIITEFYTKSADTGMENKSGAGWVVKTQHDRGLFYEQFVLGLIECRNCVGWHWFKYLDNDPAAPGDPSNTNSNKGIETAQYEPYTPLLDLMKRVNERTYSLADYFDTHPTTP